MDSSPSYHHLTIKSPAFLICRVTVLQKKVLQRGQQFSSVKLHFDNKYFLLTL